jgi:hypothetical protein
MSDTLTETTCGVWNGPHICRLPADEDHQHAGDHRCGGCGDVWNQGLDDYDENFENDHDGPTCEDELGVTYAVPETEEERRLGRLRMGAVAHEALTTSPGVRGHRYGRDRTSEPPCPSCDAIEREAAALVALGVMAGARGADGANR